MLILKILLSNWSNHLIFAHQELTLSTEKIDVDHHHQLSQWTVWVLGGQKSDDLTTSFDELKVPTLHRNFFQGENKVEWWILLLLSHLHSTIYLYVLSYCDHQISLNVLEEKCYRQDVVYLLPQVNGRAGLPRVIDPLTRVSAFQSTRTTLCFERQTRAWGDLGPWPIWINSDKPRT